MPRRAALVVDPKEQLSATLAPELAALGLETATIRDTRDGLARLDDEALALVLVAGDTPDAATFVETARARRPDLPVILTARSPAPENALRLRPLVERALARQRDAALETVHRLVSRSAHEINNPLGGLKLYARLIEQRLAKAGDTYGEGLAQKVEHAIDRLTGLVVNLAGHGHPADLPTQPVAVNVVLTEVLTRVRDRMTKDAIEETVELGKAIGAVHANPEALGRLFLQLIANALDAMPSGGRLTVKSRRADAATVEVVIEDRGTGMDAETLARATDIFFTTRQHAAGLGLATAHSVVESLGGRIEIESEPGRGTLVTVRLPAIP